MRNHKYANHEWDGMHNSVSAGTLAILQDIRDELKTLNRTLACPNFLAIPHTLRRIQASVNRIPPRKRKVKK
jgi:hypothetical protein